MIETHCCHPAPVARRSSSLSFRIRRPHARGSRCHPPMKHWSQLKTRASIETYPDRPDCNQPSINRAMPSSSPSPPAPPPPPPAISPLRQRADIESLKAGSALRTCRPTSRANARTEDEVGTSSSAATSLPSQSTKCSSATSLGGGKTTRMGARIRSHRCRRLVEAPSPSADDAPPPLCVPDSKLTRSSTRTCVCVDLQAIVIVRLYFFACR